MMHLLKHTSLWFLFILYSGQGIAASQGAILLAPKKLTDHSYAWIGPLGGPSADNKGYRMNLGFIVGKKAVADAGYTEAMATEMLEHITY
jgi:hypothetical protein